jgi:very-short-patch-repair endonuclease
VGRFRDMDLEPIIAGSSLGDSFPLDPGVPFTRAQAKAAGVSRHVLDRLTNAGILRKPIRGVFLATELGDSLALRAACLRLVAPPDAVIVDRHAGWLYGATMVLRPNEHLELRPVTMFLPGGRGRLRNPLSDSGERTFAPGDVIEVEGLRVTSPLRTACDLGRVRWPDQAIAALDAMLRLGAFSKDELLAEITRFRGMRWVTTLRAIAVLADGRSESPGESVLRLRCIECLLDLEPQVEVWLGGVLVARLDLADLELMLAVEYDGAEWHSSPEQREHDRERRTDLSENHGWLIRPFTKDEVFGRARECERILHEVAREARRRRGLRVRV